MRQVIDYTKQRAILVGRELHGKYQPWYHDFFSGWSDERISDVLESCTLEQRESLKKVARRVACGILPILGCAGSGKTKVSLRFIQAAKLQDQAVLVASTTNAAFNNICRRATEENADESHLHVRVHPERLEHSNIVCYDASVGFQVPASSSKQKKKPDRYHWPQSVARRVLQVSGIIETTNPKQLSLALTHADMSAILKTPAKERTQG